MAAQPRNRAVTDIIGAGNFPCRLAPVATLDSLALLVRGQFRFPPHLYAARHGAALPSLVRARISSRSNSASPPRTVSINRPCAVVVSAHASPRERNPAFLLVMVARVLRRSRVDLATRRSRGGSYVAIL
jgi:hypothetical protein